MPMTPPPMMTREPYTRPWSSSSSSEVMASSSPGMGGRAGTEPVAIRMRSAVKVLPSTATCPGPRMEAAPRNRSIFRWRNSPSMPARSWATTWSFFRWAAAKSSAAPGALRPHSPPVSASRFSWAAWSRALVGTHPRFRQVPPTSRPSATAVRRPSWAARRAAS